MKHQDVKERDIDIVAIGELLIDFTPINMPQGIGYKPNPGGAPANVLVQISRLGGQCSFVGMVGKDLFGRFLADVLCENNIDTQYLCFSEDVPTTLAFVQLSEDGERCFTFYRNPGADIMLQPRDVNTGLIGRANLLHFGSLSLTDEPVASATRHAVALAHEQGKLISFDPNWRPLLWSDTEFAWDQMNWGIKQADLVKVSLEELKFLTGENSIKEGCKRLYAMGPHVVFVTLGADGSCFYDGRNQVLVPGYSVKSVDTTGAGDAFWGALLYRFIMDKTKLQDVTKEQWEEYILFANAAAALCVTRYGAIPAMPDMKSIRKLISLQ